MSSEQSKEEVYATLLLNDGYLPGALVVAKSLRSLGATRKLIVLVTESKVSKQTMEELRSTYDEVITVDSLINADPSALTIMSRPDLAATFTKILLWEQTQYAKIMYLDADTLPLRAPEELFALPVPFAAGPEIGFPDCFNSGVMLLEPSLSTFHQLRDLALKGTSFDGGDQGLLNIHFRDFHRLSFMYNVELYRTYRLYMPAMNHHRERLTTVHFIGKDKPWNLKRGLEPVDESAYARLYVDFVDRWWDVYESLAS